MEYLLLGVGGALGSITRYKLGKMIAEKHSTTYPIGTFIINITGALLLGILSSLNSNKNVYILLGDGFLGAYTTFSTFMYEGFNLFQENEKINAFIYILSTLILGIIGYTIGLKIGSLFI
ncbi:CrcB protein [Caloramator quimbayensis]|uniref:Fluoride-specific ion channel FluC n=1 Tax=Caloramator quimbayensis TaxID=1147123 RepID=A0A1T4Y4S7_9CLOT|nr:fluoride efflux transporter CrcB [Caloramator quimbayensis]SKA96797.1 CrcB protein [Caloramator quimbayensis]